MNRLQWVRGALPTPRLWHAIAAGMALLTAAAGVARAEVDEKTLHLTPARVAYVDGDVSFWRPGAGDWETATVNIPLATGDALATRDGRFEVQIGPQAFLRAADATQVRVKSQEPDFLQIEVSQGSVVLDLRQLPPGHVVELDSAQGAMTANHDGFYRVDVGADSTRVTVRRAGVASLTPAGGQPIQVATGDSATIDGGAVGQLNLVAAPAFDEWDRWNYARADASLAAPRSYAVSTDVYGAADLDRYGGWRYVPTYGRVWVPYSVPTGWAPYTYGRWLWDPIYGYSWVDYAPWGWAPFHYGRWVYAGYWAWAPGPVVFAPVYAPALVSFFTPAVSVSVGFGFPFVGWTALSWGEPLVPWWGGVGFVGVPCWYGWGGPRVVNNIVINNGDTVNANQINIYRNAKVPGGLVGVPKNQFGSTDMQRVRLASLTNNDVKPLHGVSPASLSSAPSGTHAVPKSGLPDLSPGRGAPQTIPGGGPAGFTRQAPAGTGALGAAAAPPKPGAQSAPFDRLHNRTVEAAREPLPKQALPSVGAGTGSSGTATAPPPLRGLSKPEGGSADAYRRLRSGAAPTSRAAVAPSYPRGVPRAPVAKSAPPALESRRAAPAGSSNWNRAESAAPAVPRPRAMARVDSAPSANFAPQAKPLRMPSLSSGGADASPAPAGPSGGSMGSGGLGAGGMGGGGLSRGGGGMGGGGGGGGGGRPNFSR